MKSRDFVCWVFFVCLFLGQSVCLGGGFLSFICSFKGNSFELLEATLEVLSALKAVPVLVA